MKFSKIFDVNDIEKKNKYKEQHIEHVTANSKLVKNNSIFVTDFSKKVKKKYIDEAISRGAIAILTNKKIKDLKLPQFVFSNLQQKLNQILNILHPYPPDNIIAVTGTNGKTSVVWFISNILKLSGLNVISSGTLGYYKNLKKISESILTTPEKEELHQFSYSKVKENRHFVFEASSHGISNNRIINLPINVAALTNISHDHLDYHKTFVSYKETKFKLFLKHLNKKGFAIINDNIKDINFLKAKLKKNNIKIISYGKNHSDVRYFPSTNKIKVKNYSNSFKINFTPIKEFELENLLCAICCCLAIGLKIKQILKCIPKIIKPEGRMQFVNSLNNKAKVFVDYAHTPEALRNILISKNKNEKPSIVFGCGGDRDKYKRAIMGKIADKLANKVYITDDNPRNEDPNLIRKDIHLHCSKAKNIDDRKLAIKIAIENLDNNEILIIAGKGHEKKQIIKNKSKYFNDVKIANYYIKKINSQKKSHNLKSKIENFLISKSQKIKINSNEIKKGDIFCALQGSNHHGNIFIDKALKNGAIYAVTDKTYKKKQTDKVLVVKNIFTFLEGIAKRKRKIFQGKVIAITGSVGKTSIKEYLHHFLSSQGKVSYSLKSYNNYLGVLLSIININLNSKFSIFEIGTNNFGEVGKLASLVLPDQVIISNIYPTHLMNFKNTRNIAIEKSDLFNTKYNTNIKLLILPNNNKDEIYLNEIAKKNNIKNIITYGDNSNANYFIKKINKLKNNKSFITYTTPKKNFKFETKNLHKHQILNLIIPLIIFNFNNIPIKDFILKIKKIPTIYGRGSNHLIYLNHTLVKLINESYNASPVSMLNSIRYFNEIKTKKNQKKILIIGEMLELGKKSSFFHKRIILVAIKQSIEIIVFCGNQYKVLLSEKILSQKNIFYFKGENKIIEFLNNNVQKNDIILAKGSNSSKVNILVEKLVKKRKYSC